MKKQRFICSFLFINCLLLLFLPLKAQKVDWISFSQLQTVYAQNPRPILIDLYTSWCGWCKVMDKKTYGNAKVAAYINEHYYAVKYNAESKDSVIFNGKMWGYNKRYRTNELAIMLSNGDLSYPNTVFLETLQTQPTAIAGYMPAAEMEAPIKYLIERKANESFDAFRQRMIPKWN